MDAVAPGISKRLHLFRLARDVVGVAVFHVAAGGAPLEVAVEFYAVGWIKIDALHPAAQAFTLGKAGHHGQAVAKDHAVGPMRVVLVKLGLGAVVGQTVEVGKHVDLRIGRLLIGLALALEVIDQHLRMDLLLDVERRCVDHQV